MARVTVEDCIRQVTSRFELILMAATRSRQISSGQPLLVERDNDRDPIVALREIADGKITADEMNEKIISDLSRPIGIDDTALEERRLLEPDASEMSEEEMLKSLTALEAKTTQTSYTAEDVDFEYKITEKDVSEPTDQMIAEEEIRIAEELLEDENISASEILDAETVSSDKLPPDELPPASLSADEQGEADEPPNSDDTPV